MKCPKCGYHSFDHLDSCKKCGQGLAEHKAKFNLRGFFATGHAAAAAAAPAPDVAESFEEDDTPEDGSVDFGFDFLDEPDDSQAVNINQPFGADSETIPADEPDRDSDDKPGKGPEFAF